MQVSGMELMVQRGTSKLSSAAPKHDSYQPICWDCGCLSYRSENGKEREAFKFCLSPEFRHLSTVQIRFCGTKICNQNALPALLCLSHLSVSKDNCLLLHFQKIASEKGEEEEEVILLNTFCITVLL